MTNRKGYVSDAPAFVHTPGVGAIWLVRDNAIVKDYADTRVTEIDYGNGLQQALTDAQAFDTIMVGPGRFQGVNIQADTPDVTIIFNNTELLASTAAYDQLFHITATALRNELIGLTTRDSNPGVTGEGAGIRVNGNESKVIDCKGYDHKGTLGTQGYGLWAIGADLEIRRYFATGCKYTGIRTNDANRLLIADSFLLNNGTDPARNRCIQIEGSLTIDWVRIENTTTLSNVADTGALINISTNGRIENVTFSNVKTINKVQYNTTAREQNMKFQNIGVLTLDNCVLQHLTNAGTGFHTGIAFDFPVDELNMKNCIFSDGASLVNGTTNRLERVNVDGCYFGRDQSENAGGLFIWGVNGRHVSFRNTTFNCHDSFRIFSQFPNENANAGDVLEFDNCHFTGSNDTSHQNIADDVDPPRLLQNPRKVINTNATYANTGIGGFEFRPSNWEGTNGNENMNLMMSTNNNGDMLWDSTRVGSGPTEGMPAAPFTGVPGYKGQKIIDISWSGTGTREWQFGGTAWAPVP